jgi:zinc transport system ATP-binding protein
MNSDLTLRVYQGEREIFSSTGKWLYPLFELEEFLSSSSYQTESLRLEDKIVGKAAALLLIRLGIRQVKAGVLSKLGREVLERFQIQYSATEIVERIDCQTETLLAEVEDPEQAYRIVAARAKRRGSAGD